MSRISIKCDQMMDVWNFDTCRLCPHFNLYLTQKGRKWSCSLNRKPASQKREFWSIWAHEFLRGHGVHMTEDEISIEYVGKQKVRKPKGAMSDGNDK